MINMCGGMTGAPLFIRSYLFYFLLRLFNEWTKRWIFTFYQSMKIEILLHLCLYYSWVCHLYCLTHQGSKCADWKLIFYRNAKRRVVSGWEQGYSETTPLPKPQTSCCSNERLFDNIGEPSACWKFRSEFMDRVFFKCCVKKVTSFVCEMKQ